ncbi:hypothetical protein KY417_001183 [Campylobacter jejuni]|nr:hypothetical protein [Campylobacter jejuni]EFP2059073.1 hypothetical protein [Campylobacter jejuni]EHU3473186.1 hypothetical protein [Campylobacter jejuni]
MQKEFILQGMLKCPCCKLEFVAHKDFIKIPKQEVKENQRLNLSVICPDCDYRFLTSFLNLRITREFKKTYTLRC